MTIGNLYFLDKQSTDLNSYIDPIYQAIDDDDMETAQKYYDELVKAWQKYEVYWHIAVEHSELEKIENNLVELASCIKSRNNKDALTAVALLRFNILHIPQMERVSIENLF